MTEPEACAQAIQELKSKFEAMALEEAGNGLSTIPPGQLPPSLVDEELGDEADLLYCLFGATVPG